MQTCLKKIKTIKKLATFIATPLLLFLVDATPGNAFTLSFDGTPSLISGADLQPGAQYEYTSIATDPVSGITIDAVVTLDGLQNNAILGSPFDNTSVFDDNIQPQLTVPGGTVFGPLTITDAPTAEFSVDFFNAANGNNLALSGFTAQANDVDGDGGIIQEGVRFFGADTLAVGSGITQSSGTNARGAFLQGQSSSTNANPGIGAEPTNLVIGGFNSDVETFQFDYFFTADASAPSSTAVPRLNSLLLEATSVTEVPFGFSPALGLFLSGLGISFHQFGKKRKNFEIEK